jgi:gliding motility-associated-like protein
MQKWFLLIVLSFHLYEADAQGTWTWLHGDSVTHPIRTNVNRGVKGVASPSNLPSRFLYNGINWKDPQDKFWVFGKKLTWDQQNDTSEVWSYDYKSNQWTWEAGFDTFYIDGSLPNQFMINLRKDILGSALFHWTDSLGNLWYYSNGLTRDLNNVGYFYNVLQKFNIKTKRIEAINHRVHYNRGVKGVASAINWPGSLSGAVWRVDNRVYLFGGSRAVIRPSGSLENEFSNELWEYNMATNLWTWLGGNTPPSQINYGSKGVAAVSNWPPNVFDNSSNWIDGNKCYFAGGAYYGSNVYGGLSDLWEYDIITGLWTWVSGSTISDLNSNGIYSGKTHIDSNGLFPSARIHGSSVQSNICKNSFWFYSGESFQNTNKWLFADLWIYKPSVNRWQWVYGVPNDTLYSYGVKGIPRYSNKPPIRQERLMWTDNLGRLYLFGGSTYNIKTYDSMSYYYYKDGNDLWRYDPDYGLIYFNNSSKFIIRDFNHHICLGDSSVIRIRKGYDSLRVSPMTSVTLRQTDTTTEVWLKPSTNMSYKIIAYGYRCESQLDSLTIPIVVSPPRTSSESKTICFGASYIGKSTTGTHIFKYSDQLKCDSVHTLYLIVRPEIVSIIDSTVCEGTSVFGRSVSGTYNDPFAASNGCDSTRRLRLTVIPRNLTIDTSICRGRSIYGYSIDSAYYDTLTSTQGCITYRVIRLRIKEHSSSSYSQSICEGQSYWGHSTSGTHTDILTAANGCDSTRTLNLTVNKKSFFTLNQEICRGDSYEGKSQAGTYLDTFINAKGCDSIRTLVLTLRNAKPIKKLKDTAICKGSDAVFDAGIGHISYLWTTGAQTHSIQISQVGEYKLSYTDTANCVGRDSAVLSFYNDTEIILEDELSNYKGELLILNPKIKPSDVGGKYRWSPSQIFSCDTCRTVRFKLDSSAVVKLEFTDAQGCKAYKDVKVNIYDSWAVGFPTAFSPNGDALNDTYFPNVANILSYTYAVYNRWGEKVYQATNIQPAWNGTFRGQPCPMGMYSYYADVILLNGVRRTYSGSFQVVR